MNNTCEYKGKIYTRNNSKWVDRDHMVVPAYLQQILNTLVFEREDFSKLSYNEAKKNGDKHKASESYSFAVKYYEEALKKADCFMQISVLLPRITSCYRKINQPKRVIELLSEAKAKYGEGIITKVLLTSVAAAYCDLNEPENALKCCRWAYKKLKDENDESLELSNVFERAQKMLDPDYSRDEYFEELELQKLVQEYDTTIDYDFYDE